MSARRRLDAAWARVLQQRQARLQRADAVLRGHRPAQRLALLRARLQRLQPRAQATIVRTLQQRTQRLHGLARALEAVSPLATVARGYAILQREDGSVLRLAADAHPGELLDARLQDGQVRVRVEGRGTD